MSQESNNDDDKLLQSDSGFRFLPELTSDELRAVLKFTQWVSSQATSLQATTPDKPIILEKAIVRFNADELKKRALKYFLKETKMAGVDYIRVMMEHPHYQYHISQFLYSGVISLYHESDFINDRGDILPGISFTYDYMPQIPATDMKALRDIHQRLNVIREKKAYATCSGDYAIIDDLCDEEEKRLHYVRKAMADSKLDARARKDYHIVLDAVKRVIDKIRKKYKDDEVADYLQEHIRTGIYCYWEE